MARYYFPSARWERLCQNISRKQTTDTSKCVDAKFASSSRICILVLGSGRRSLSRDIKLRLMQFIKGLAVDQQGKTFLMLTNPKSCITIPWFQKEHGMWLQNWLVQWLTSKMMTVLDRFTNLDAWWGSVINAPNGTQPFQHLKGSALNLFDTVFMEHIINAWSTGKYICQWVKVMIHIVWYAALRMMILLSCPRIQ